MVKPKDIDLARRLESTLTTFSRDKHPLSGIANPARRASLIEQLIESIHRVKYVSVIKGRNLDPRVTDPNDSLFDPVKAAIVFQRAGDLDDAFWMVFLFVHFGKHRTAGWAYIREIYGRLGDATLWGWREVSADPRSFRQWLDKNQSVLRAGKNRGFGNHRKYESLNAFGTNGTGAAVESYVAWVGPPRTHPKLMEQAKQEARGDRKKAFDALYRSMRGIARFGRTARFDYLTMIGKLGLAEIEPGSTYMQGATGPLSGARLLFGQQARSRVLDCWLVELDADLNVGMQVLEDALCNWQKSPDVFQPFRG